MNQPFVHKVFDRILQRGGLLAVWTACNGEGGGACRQLPPAAGRTCSPAAAACCPCPRCRTCPRLQDGGPAALVTAEGSESSSGPAPQRTYCAVVIHPLPHIDGLVFDRHADRDAGLLLLLRSGPEPVQRCQGRQAQQQKRWPWHGKSEKEKATPNPGRAPHALMPPLRLPPPASAC